MRRDIHKIIGVVLILAFILNCIVCFVTLGIVTRKDSRELSRYQAESVLKYINNMAKDMIDMGRAFADDPEVVALLDNYDKYDKDALEDEITYYMKLANKVFNCDACSVYIADNGAYYYKDGFRRYINMGESRHDNRITGAMNANWGYVIDIDRNPEDNGEWTLYINTKIENEYGETIGLFGLGKNLQELNDLFAEYKTTKNTDVYITDGEGNVLMDHSGTYLEEPIYGIVDVDTTFFIGDCTYEVYNHHGYKVSVPLNELGMYVIFQNPRDDLLQTEWKMAASEALILAIIVAVLILIINWIVKKEKAEIEKDTKVESYYNFSSIYSTMYMVDLDAGTFRNIVSSSSLIRFIEEKEGLLKDLDVKHIVEGTVEQEFVEKAEEFIEFDTLISRMEMENSITLEVIGKHLGWCRLQYIKTDGYESHKLLFTVEVIDEYKRRVTELKRLSEMDIMTGVYNRGSGEKKIKRRLLAGKEGMFVVIDVDKFKKINDSFGHAVGDNAILSVANALKMSFRNNDIVMRLGGDEFAVFAEGVENREEADKMFERLFTYMENIDIPEMNGAKIEISVGAEFVNEGANISFDDIYRRADDSTYKSKETKGNTVTYYN